jgi:hypothetical protein
LVLALDVMTSTPKEEAMKSFLGVIVAGAIALGASAPAFAVVKTHAVEIKSVKGRDAEYRWGVDFSGGGFKSVKASRTIKFRGPKALAIKVANKLTILAGGGDVNVQLSHSLFGAHKIKIVSRYAPGDVATAENHNNQVTELESVALDTLNGAHP